MQETLEQQRPKEPTPLRIEITWHPSDGRMNISHPNDLFVVLQLLADASKVIAQKAAQERAQQSRIQLATPQSLRRIPRA